MKALQAILISFLSFLPISPILAQSAYLQLDKPYYFHGEYLFYSLFLGEIKTDSAVLLFRLAQGEEILDQHYQANDEGFASGYFKLPHQLSSGEYEIHAFAFDKKDGEPIGLLNTPISIFGKDSPSQRPGQYVSQIPIPPEQKFPEIELNFKAIAGLENAMTSCLIQGLGSGTSKLSVGIRKLNGNEHAMGNLRFFTHDLHERECASQLAFLSTKAHSDSTTDKPSSSALIYAFQADSLLFNLASMDSEGKVFLKFPRIYGSSELQLLDFFLSSPVSLEPLGIPAPPRSESLQIPDTSIATAYSLYQKRKQIYQLFNRLPIQVQNRKLELNKEFIPADFELDVQDYAVKGKLADLFSEFVSPLNFRKKKGKTSIRVFYRVKGQAVYHKFPPLFVVNGIATQRADFINSLLLQEVKSIRIYSELETLGALVGSYNIGGIIEIDLVDPLYEIPEEFQLAALEINGLQMPINYPLTGDLRPDIPRIQSLIYWAPQHPVIPGNDFQLQFPSPDLDGMYRLDMLIQASNGKLNARSFLLRFEDQVWQYVDE